MKFERYQTSQIKVRSYGDTTVVTGRLLRTRTVTGNATRHHLNDGGEP
jgi:hypothetical protein